GGEVADPERLDRACVKRAGAQTGVAELLGEVGGEHRGLLRIVEAPEGAGEERLDMWSASVPHSLERARRPVLHHVAARPALPHTGAHRCFERELGIDLALLL